MKILNANMLSNNPRQQISVIFTDGFYQWLKYFTKNKNKLSNTFEHMFNLDVFFVAVIDEKIAGIAAINDGSSPTVQLSKKEFQKHLGFLKGLIAYKVLKHEFEEKKYPFALNPQMASIEFVATSQSHLRKGVASEIIEYFLSLPKYQEYALEVADTNINAVKLYEKLGFKEFMRVEMKNKKQSGVNNLIYMKFQK